MKKIFLTLLLLPVAVNAFGLFRTETKPPFDFSGVRTHYRFEEALIEFDQENKKRREYFANPEYLRFILGRHLDLHFYGVMTPARAQVAVFKIHENLAAAFAENKDFFKAGKALNKKPDASIVNTCTKLEQGSRKDGNAGEISGTDPMSWFFTSRTSNFPGEKFFENACPCNLYKNLTDEQLEQLRKGTE